MIEEKQSKQYGYSDSDLYKFGKDENFFYTFIFKYQIRSLLINNLINSVVKDIK